MVVFKEGSRDLHLAYEAELFFQELQTRCSAAFPAVKILPITKAGTRMAATIVSNVPSTTLVAWQSVWNGLIEEHSIAVLLYRGEVSIEDDATGPRARLTASATFDKPQIVGADVWWRLRQTGEYFRSSSLADEVFGIISEPLPQSEGMP